MLAIHPNETRAGHRLGGLGGYLCEDSQTPLWVGQRASQGHTELCSGPSKEPFNVSGGPCSALAGATKQDSELPCGWMSKMDARPDPKLQGQECGEVYL